MRHAAPRNNNIGRRRRRRTAEIAIAGIAYLLSGLSAALTVLGSALALWTLWQQLGVN